MEERIRMFFELLARIAIRQLKEEKQTKSPYLPQTDKG